MTHLDIELDHIRSRVYEMADRAIESIDLSIASLKALDGTLAGKVIADDSVLDRLEKDIDEECINILVTRQPAAKDLRFVLSMLKINTDLERIGDLSVNIANETRKLIGAKHVKELIDIPRMGEIAVGMIKGALRAITEMDAAVAREVIRRDDEMDALNRQIFRELFAIMQEDPTKLSAAFSLILVSRSLERIGDHVTNIAERAVYFIEGVDIRHEKNQG